MWTPDEESFLIENYSDKEWYYLLNNLNRHTKKQIQDKAYSLCLKRNKSLRVYGGRAPIWSDSKIDELRKAYASYDSLDDVVNHFDGKYSKKQISKKAHRLGLNLRKRVPKSTKTIYDLIRKENDVWKRETLKCCGYKCIFTGSNNIDIHHIYPFKKLLDESMNELGFDIYNEQNLLEEDIQNIRTVFYLRQAQNGYGVCIDKRIHRLFHSVYGFKNFTPHDWSIFTNDLLSGKYNYELANKGLTNIHLNFGEEIVESCVKT